MTVSDQIEQAGDPVSVNRMASARLRLKVRTREYRESLSTPSPASAEWFIAGEILAAVPVTLHDSPQCRG